MALSPEQIRAFEEDGVLVARGVLQAEDLQPVIDELEEFIDNRAQLLHKEGKITDLHAHAPFDKRYGLLFAQCRDIGKGMDIMHYRGQAIFEFLGNQNLLDAVEGLVGPEITCNPIQHVRAKPPTAYEAHSGPSFHAVPWHQDAGVMMSEAEDSQVVTCWLPLGDSTVEMGCLQALPGVVQKGYLRHLKEGGTTIRPELMPDIEPRMLECARGDLVFLSRFTPHRSEINDSERCRWSLDLRYQPTGQHTGRTGHPEFIVRSPSQPDRVMADYQTWCNLWVDAFENPRGFVGHRSE
ncbi:MAG: mitomycin antibiotic biosynthesis protein [Candidatus Latescibacteria bacterium]|nr:mitomycin antibiotic biosynthesis protein [Candidatus Latescibacterota bacterium]